MRAVMLSLLLALGLAGCGGGGGEPAPPAADSDGSGSAAPAEPVTRADFIAQGDALCEKVNRQARSLNRRLQAAADETQDSQTQLKALAPIIEDGYELQTKSYAEFAALTPPEENRAVFERLNRVYDDQASLVSRLSDAAAEGDTARFVALSDEIEQTRTRSRGLAQGYGFKVCGSGNDSG